ncbi:hypothetical protein A4A49_35931 [Nicotiana attenuata]|uniref:Uncharacterized protein n=1 Tax=Nicotiana attenuata TaxID=49451 RepID=A0A1J6KGW2_NICAT|nr:hypothetical protein A4A49_35931 [Nicotiana attenuata]
MDKTKPSPSSSMPPRSHRFKKNPQTDDTVDVESSESSDHQQFEDESRDSQEEIIITQKRTGKRPMESNPEQSFQKKGKFENIEFGPEDKINFYGPDYKSKFVAYKGKSIAYGRTYMLESIRDVSSSANSLPYGLLISHILQVMKVDLSPYAPKIISSTYDKTSFTMMGYTLVKGTWFKKYKAPKFTPQQGTRGIKSEASKSSPSEQLLPMQQNIVGIKELLTSMQEQMNKIREVTKETRADLARLRINHQATKRQGIRAMQEVTKKLTKVTKENDPFYDSFCTKVINTLKYFLGRN